MHLLFIALLYFPSKKIIILYFKRERWFFLGRKEDFFFGEEFEDFFEGRGFGEGFF